MLRTGLILAMTLFHLVGCAESAPSLKDLRVIQAAHQAEAHQSQGIVAGLRAELQDLRRELGAARVEQAQLKGASQDTERRLAEAHLVADTQRDELARARDERARLMAVNREAQGQLVELGSLRQQVAEAGRNLARIQALEATIEKQALELTSLKASRVKPDKKARSRSRAATATVRPPVESPKTASKPGESRQRTVTVKPRDTLSTLAQRHGVPVEDLRALNSLAGDHLVQGQELVLPPAPGR